MFQPNLKIKRGEDYELVPHGEDEYHVEILDGPYMGFRFQFLTVEILEGNPPVVKFDFQITRVPDPSPPFDLKLMKSFTVEILHDILLSGLKESDGHTDRDDGAEAPAEGRGVLPKGDSVSRKDLFRE